MTGSTRLIDQPAIRLVAGWITAMFLLSVALLIWPELWLRIPVGAIVWISGTVTVLVAICMFFWPGAWAAHRATAPHGLLERLLFAVSCAFFLAFWALMAAGDRFGAASDLSLAGLALTAGRTHC